MPTPKASPLIQPLPGGGTLTVTHYFFKSVGDEIPLHEHTFWHSVGVIDGCAELLDEHGNAGQLRPGNVFGIPAGVKHAIRALQDGTRTIHVTEPRPVGSSPITDA